MTRNLVRTLASSPLAAGLFLASATAAAAFTTLYTFDDDGTTTQRSGTGSGYGPTDILEPTGGLNYQGLYQVSMWEDTDVPCKIQAKFRHLNTYVGKQVTWDNFGQCGVNASTKRTVKFTDTESYVRGVNVCLNNAGDRVKGMRIYGAKLNRSTGALTNLSGFKGWSRPNCDDWQTIRYCPPGKVATRLIVEDEPGNGIQGVRLTCRSISPS